MKQEVKTLATKASAQSRMLSSTSGLAPAFAMQLLRGETHTAAEPVRLLNLKPNASYQVAGRVQPQQ
jgi:hypothetical protein